MLAHSSSYLRTDSSEHHPMTSKRRLPTTLSVAITLVLSSFTMQAYAQTDNRLSVDNASVEYPITHSSAVMDEVLGSSSASVERKTFVANRTQLFLECQDLQVSAARLACYDKVAFEGKTPTSIETKQPVDLAKTIKSTILGKPQVVLANDNRESQVKTESSVTTKSLDTVGLTRREAEVLEDIGVTQDDIEKYSPLSLAYDLNQNNERGTWTVRPYRPNYVLPIFYSFDPNLSPTSSNPDEPGEEYTANDIRNTELKFQLSLKTKVGEDLFDTNADLWFGYTQQAHWQVYNEDNSRPFRGTDYQPEVFLTQPVTADLPFDGRLRMLGAGIIHHSNGRSDPISRSWNRAYLMAGAEWGKFSIVPRVWARINNESDSSEDNPDIEDYLGYGDIKFLYDLPKQQSLSGTLRYNPSTNKGAAQIDYIYPLSDNVNGYVQLFQGYGESIIDYDYENTAIGLGIVLNDWKGF